MIEKMTEIARNAGDLLKRYSGNLRNIKTKAIASDVFSEADLESQKLITNSLIEVFPGVKVIGEENYGGEDYKSGKVFLVDPLDGSLNYIHCFPFYSVSIAYLEDGEVLAGVVHLPEYNETFYAEKGKGAFLNGERIFSDKKISLEDSMIITGWPYNEEGIKWTYKAIEVVNEKVHEIRILGSCAAELSYLAAGRLDGYFEIGLKPWDLAAGYLIATEAGLKVSSITADYFDMDLGEVVAAPESFQKKLVDILRGVS
ncbi:MAG: inositol monophosphatase [Thermotogaceae bacterium]|nr:inositol monophosphatase [Thermotogaceae bacterium]